MKALVLERTRELALRDIDLPLEVGPGDVRIKIHTVGVCGSDVHYYVHGAIGPFRVDAPMVLGHEAAGIVVETGADVTHLRVGDRVCMEPGVPRLDSPATLRGLYNLDPDVRFWATPPVHGCLTPYVVHPAAFTYRLPDNVSFAEGAIVEPLSIGLQAAKKAAMKPGDIAVVIGAGTIGAMTTLAALAGGAARVILADVVPDKLALFDGNPAVTTVDVRTASLADAVADVTGGWGADVVFEASGSANAYANLVALMCAGGCAVLIGMPVAPVPLDVVALQAKEGRIESVFRYANIFPRALALIASGAIDVKPFISRTFPFSEGVRAFEEAASGHPRDVKIQIEMD
ncbi:NAD(P)-dependent alcohol dehydrogenase [Burkholderia multivorans]|uniref:NAD(P)-dependent alcohol dehydrogenase n=1 Tax=Burkholderia TaxID=32008 RepID=UPI0008A1E09A|nr:MULTISPECIES: NAD(P)-dependent alcohol dehydrogenase [Burkholderia]MBJ9680627.1 NAD(P)-dependent alcohol dehydrogenase [Burkholderia multivorans]MCA8372957.1 NAD(P)-dependent alcohol dehydrogenase [Burkholderia multivorans]MDR8919838.1 D-xylulose reductase [Burkholderia multivorans]MDR8926142.1 D-xylulose reductase [Burkholderia multivorans]MDR8967262.1 D-xylulose reductase [Burkholderia multivorans]